ncbi:MAG: ABC transporter ATP-binding protein [Parvibaculaceae bacterium]
MSTLAQDGGLHARDVHVAFGGLKALKGVDLELRRGEVLGLIGPNGAGKTTMVNVLTGFQPVTAGAVTLDGRSIAGLGPRNVARAGVARSFQAARLFRDLTVRQNLEVAAIGSGRRRKEARAQADALLDWIGCRGKADLPAGSLPYGDERRIGIARALALTPKYVLLDEPASGMNDQECEALMKLIAEIPDRFDCGVLLIEHNMQVVMGACRRVHVLDNGKSLAEGTPAEMRANQEVRRAYLGTKTGRGQLI